MVDVIRAVWTVDARKYLPRLHAVGGVGTTHQVIDLFKMGGGGFVDPGGGPIPRDPEDNLRLVSDPYQQDLDMIVDPERPLGQQRYTGLSLDLTTPLEGALAAPDFAAQDPSSLRVKVFLDFAEGNGGGTAEYWEIGLFMTQHPDDTIRTGPGSSLMVAYGTMPKVTKTAASQYEAFVLLTY